MDRTNKSDMDSSQNSMSAPDSGARTQKDPTKMTGEAAPSGAANPGQRSATRQPDSSSMPENMAGQARDTVNQVVGSVQQEATRRMTDQIHHTQEGLGSTAHAIRSASQDLRERDQAMFADVVERAAEQIDGVASYLRDKDLDQIVNDAENFARRQPAIFVAGAAMLGMLAGRFLKSSSPRSSSGSMDFRAADYRGGLRALPGGGTRPTMGATGTQTSAQAMYPQFGAQGQPGSSMPTDARRPGREPEAGTGTTSGSTRS